MAQPRKINISWVKEDWVKQLKSTGGLKEEASQKEKNVEKVKKKWKIGNWDRKSKSKKEMIWLLPPEPCLCLPTSPVVSLSDVFSWNIEQLAASFIIRGGNETASIITLWEVITGAKMRTQDIMFCQRENRMLCLAKSEGFQGSDLQH